MPASSIDPVRLLLAVAACWSFAAVAPAQEVILIDQLPLRIQQPGVYRLSRDLDFPNDRGQAISIEADHVTLDLNGRTLSGSAGAGTLARGVHANNRRNIKITHGRIRGFYFGIDLRNDTRSQKARSRDHVIARLRLDRNWYFGVRVMGTGCEIRDCEITDTGGCSREKHTIPHAARLVGARNVMRDCSIRNLELQRTSDGKGEIVGVHFDAAKGALFERNRLLERIDPAEAAAASNDDPTERRFGLWINGGPNNDTALTVRNNSFIGFPVPIVFAPGADGTATGNTFQGASPNPIRGKPTGKISGNRVLDSP